MNDQLITDLKETRRQLEIRGRCTTVLCRSNGNVCLDGAIIVATRDQRAVAVDDWLDLTYTELYTPRAREVLHALIDQLPDSFKKSGSGRTHEKVFNFNDHHTTTDADCYNLIDKAIAEAGGMM